MSTALFFTAYNRPEYLRQALDSWSRVWNLQSWPVYFMVEPSSVQDDVLEEIHRFIHRSGLDHTAEVQVNPRKYGVLHHPWVGFNQLFGSGFDFVVRAEDDLIVSDDILQFFTWAYARYESDSEIGAVYGYSRSQGLPEEVIRVTDFRPWTWGTWSDRWEGFMRDTWDHDYSTFDESPMNRSGWDWNLRTRIFPSLGLKSIHPKLSRCDNIGVYGTHGTLENFEQAPAFHEIVPPVSFREGGR